MNADANSQAANVDVDPKIARATSETANAAFLGITRRGYTKTREGSSRGFTGYFMEPSSVRLPVGPPAIQCRRPGSSGGGGVPWSGAPPSRGPI